MTKIYKLQYYIQNQLLENGKIQKHRKVTTSLPVGPLMDMGIDEENNAISLHYDEKTKTITIRKA